MHEKKVHVSTLLIGGTEIAKFEEEESASLLIVFQDGATRLGVQLLPNAQEPLDRLHDILHHKDVGPAIQDLEQSLGAFLDSNHTTADFGIELVLAIRINTQWVIAPQSSLSPRQILELVNLKYQDYTLYKPGSNDPLPLDTPIALTRGQAFEAQRDGKYGYGA